MSTSRPSFGWWLTSAQFWTSSRKPGSATWIASPAWALSPTRIPRKDWPRIAAEVRETGVQVPLEWNPGDQLAFVEGVAVASRKTADAAYSDVVMKRFQQALPPGLDWEGFFSQPAIQTRWKALIDAPVDTYLVPNVGFSAFRQIVYDPRVDRLVQPRLNDLLDSPDSFAPDGSRQQAGRAAAYWVVAPSVLLAVSVLFILWHAGRLLDLGCRILLPRISGPKRWAVEVFVAAAIVTLFVAWRTPDPSEDNRSSDSVSMLGPVGATLRNAVLFDFDFGYDAAFAGDLSETAIEPLLPRAQSRL
jgi:hypothetical protein